MSEVEKIYEFVFDKSYLDKVQLSILLDNLNDKKLASGFLNSLCILHKRYEISEEHKSELLLLYLEVFGEPSKEDIIETSTYHIKNKNYNYYRLNKNKQTVLDFFNAWKNSNPILTRYGPTGI